MTNPIAACIAVALACFASHAQIEPPEGAARRQIEWVVQTMSMPPEEAAADILERSTDDFRAAISAELLTVQFQQLESLFFGDGPIRIERYDDGETARSAAALLRSDATRTPMRLVVITDDTGERIAGMTTNMVAAGGKLPIKSWEDFDTYVTGLPGRVSLAAMSLDGPDLVPVHLRLPDEPLAIGSAFKLYVLGALAELVKSGDAAWDEKLAIREDLKSLPSGILQDEPAGTEHDLTHYADLMISISDNTATDHLIERVGRERVEAFMARYQADPERSLPFLKTMEMFKIKLCGDPQLADRYASATIDERRHMLAPDGDVALATVKMWLAGAWSAPVHIDRVEWFATGPELCRAMLALHELEAKPGMEPLGQALRLNPGIAFMRTDWSGIAFKGGSEPGVLNFTWLLERSDGRFFVLAITWNNDAPVDTIALLNAASEAIALLNAHGR